MQHACRMLICRVTHALAKVVVRKMRMYTHTCNGHSTRRTKPEFPSHMQSKTLWYNSPLRHDRRGGQARCWDIQRRDYRNVLGVDAMPSQKHASCVWAIHTLAVPRRKTACFLLRQQSPCSISTQARHPDCNLWGPSVKPHHGPT